MKKTLLLIVFCATLCALAYSQTYIGNQTEITLPTTSGGNLTNALLYLPDTYNTDTISYPLIIFLHGTGEAGPDINSLLNTALPQRISQGFKVEAINPKDGKNYKFIVVSPQGPAGSWGYQQTHIKYMLPEIEKQYRIDTSRIYITGLSAGGWGTWTCITDDTGFCKKIAAIAPMSSAGVEYNAVVNGVNIPRYDNVINAAKFGVPIWSICGDQDAFYSIAVDYTNRINAASPLVAAKLTDVVGVGHSAWNQGYDPTWKVDNMNVYEWMLQYSRQNGISGKPVAVVNGDTDVTVALPQNIALLDGTHSYDQNGNLVKYKWRKLSGPNQFALNNSDSSKATLSNLAVGNYIIQLTVTDNKGASGTDTTNVIVKSPDQQNPCNGKKIYIVKGGDNGKYISGGSFAYSPGDTLVLTASQNPYSYFSLEGIHGTATCPVTIMNEGGQVQMVNGMALSNCTNIKISGTGSKDKYGFYIEDKVNGGVAIDVYGRSANVEINNIYVHNKTYGLWVKEEVQCADSLNFPNWVIDSISIHDNLIVKTGQEGMYLGSTNPNGGDRQINCNGKLIAPTPLRLGDIRVFNNIIDSTNRSGIQLSGASAGNNIIYNNTISNCGYELNVNQGNGISLGGYTHARVRGNNINNTYAMGIFVLGSGSIHLRNNIINNSGHLGGHVANGMASIMVDTRLTTPVDSSSLLVEDNQLGTNTDFGVRFYNTYRTYGKSNIICNNSGSDNGINVASGISWSDCSGQAGKSSMEQGSATSEKNVIKADINLYPNPATDVLHVRLNSRMVGNLALNIYDAQERLIQSKAVYNNSSSTETINVNNLKPGFYFLQIVGEYGKTSLKFIKER